MESFPMRFQARITPAIILLGLFLLGCDKKSKISAAHLDAILDSNRIDRVEFITFEKTNSIIGKDAQEVTASLNKTNRIKGSDWEKSQVQEVVLYSGTNSVCEFMLTDNGFWLFEDYSFRLRK